MHGTRSGRIVAILVVVVAAVAATVAIAGTGADAHETKPTNLSPCAGLGQTTSWVSLTEHPCPTTTVPPTTIEPTTTAPPTTVAPTTVPPTTVPPTTHPPATVAPAPSATLASPPPPEARVVPPLKLDRPQPLVAPSTTSPVEVLGAVELGPVEVATVEPVEPVEPVSSPDPPPDEDRSSIATALPERIDLSPAFVASNAGMGALVVLALLAAAQLFNDALKNRHDDIARRLSSRAGVIGGARAALAALPTPPPLLTFAAAAGLLGLLADPNVRFSLSTLAQVLGMVGGVAMIVLIYDGSAARSMTRRTGTRIGFRLYPVAIAVALICLALSRAVGVAPGVLYGLFTGLAVVGLVDRKTEGRIYARSSLMLIGAALVAYVVHRAVSPAAAGTDPSFATIVIDTAAAVLFVGGLQAVIVQLVPTRFVNGEKIAAWNRVAWFALLLGSVTLYLQFVVRPNPDNQHWGSAWFVAVLVIGSVTFWAWSAMHGRRTARDGESLRT